ncbi:MAG: class I SAM-dependent methyltransferase, partial [Gammaproteobacteria bacterium]|nr:class I SAM-dependent methyltransferase [Gammaproteobacteria bacterium]
LPPGAKYTATDLTPAMLNRAAGRIQKSSIDMTLLEADSMALPFDNESFDIIIMHLILSVVPRPIDALNEASRILKPGGEILILDKFLQPNQLAPIRRLINPVIKHIATRTDVVFEDLLNQADNLNLINNKPALLNGWFRYIQLTKTFAS